MDLQFHGANCISISTKHVRVVIDDNLADLGKKSVAKPGDIALFTGIHGDPAVPAKIIIDQPGEYEVAGISIYGIAARGHMDEEGVSNATMYKLITEDVKVLVVGHVYPELSDDQLEGIGMVDIMFVPVGGNGYTLDAVGALKLIKKVEPKLVVPTHFEESGIGYPVPQHALDEAIKTMAMEPKDTVAKLKAKAGEFGDITQLLILQTT